MEKTFTSSVNVMGILVPRDEKSHDIPRDKNDSPKEIIARRIPGLFFSPLTKFIEMWVHAPILLRPCEILKSRLKVLAMMMISVASLPERLLLLGPLTHSHTHKFPN